jgi:hypothetical protein
MEYDTFVMVTWREEGAVGLIGRAEGTGDDDDGPLYRIMAFAADGLMDE